MKRFLLVAAIALVWFGATVLGTAAAALRTDAGRRVVVEAARAMVTNAIDGSLLVDSVGGTYFSGLEVWNASIVGPDSTPFLVAPHVRLDYRLGTLLSGRPVLGELTIEDVEVSFIQVERDGPFNVDIIFAGDTASAEDVVGKAKPYLAFRDVRIARGTVTIRTPTDPWDDVVELERRPTGHYRVRRIEEINALFPFVRLLSPVPGEDPIAVSIQSLAARINDPGFELVSARGGAEIWGDSVRIELQEAAFPESDAHVTGTLFWPTGPLQFNLWMDSERLYTSDLAGLVGDIPRDLEGGAEVTVRSLSEDMLVMDAENMRLTGRGGGGDVSGRLGIQFGPGDMWSQRETDLTLSGFDLEYVRHLLDTLPVAGRVTGRVRANGARDSLELDVDATFRDSLVGEWPETYIRGQGYVSLGVPGDFVFRDYVLDTTDISLETVHRLIPAIQLVGRLRGSGTLTGPWLASAYDGSIRYRDELLPETVAEASIRIDATGDIVGVWGELVFDSLRLEGLQTSYPQLTAVASLAGPTTLAGYLDSLLIDARLEGPSGAVHLWGPFLFDGDRSGAHRFDIVASGLDASAYYPGIAATRIDGRATGQGWRSETMDSFLETSLDLGVFTVRGVAFDGVQARVSLRDSLISIDELRAWSGGSMLRADGALGLAQPRRAQLGYSVDLAGINLIEPWLTTILDSLDSDAPQPSGRVQITGQLNGAADAFGLLADIQANDINRGPVHVSEFGGQLTWASASRAIRLTGEIDSLQIGPVFSVATDFTVQGRSDSLQWRGGTTVNGRSTVIAGGQWATDEVETRVNVDSLRAVLHTGEWSADRFTITISDVAAVFDGFEIAHDSGTGRFFLEGFLPFAGAGDLRGSVEALPIADLWGLIGLDPAGVSGQMGGSFALTGTARDPVIRASVGVTGGKFGDFTAPQTSGELRYADRRVTGELDLVRAGNPILNVDVDLPYDLSVRDVPQRRLPGPLAITGHADSVDLSLFDAISPAVRAAVGTFDANLGITGTWEEPLLAGSLTVSGGGANFPSLGVRYENITGLLELVADTIHIRSLTLGSGLGEARVGGFVRLEELTKPILSVTIQAADFDALNVPGFLTMTTTGDVRLDGPVFGATMTGGGTVTRGVVFFADLITKEVVNLEDSLFLGLVDTTLLREEGLGAAFENRFLDSLRIDSLDLTIGSEVWLRSGEANIQLTGTVNVDKELDVYRLNGGLQTPRGTYRLEVFPTVAREFTVTRGTVRYFGTPDLNAGLDIEARHIVRVRGREENVDIFINIGGTLYEPELTLTSNMNPPLSDDEIMAFLLFGGAALDPGQTQAAEFASERLTQAVSGQLENFVISSMDVPLDYFQIRPAARGGLLAGAEVSVGKQFDILGQEAFLTATPRYCPRLTTQQFDLGASLEFRFSRRWLLEASVEPRRSCDAFTARTAGAFDRQFGLDLIWEMSY